MAIGLIGKKLGMTHIFDKEGRAIPVTVIEAGPCPVLQVKTPETDDYSAVQIGFEELRERRANQPARGHAKKAGVKPHRVVREFRVEEPTQFAVGQVLSIDLFADGEKVDVVGVSKGRGFQGVIRRFHANRCAETHGSMYHRRPGSGGASSDPSHTYKGKIGYGRMGGERSTVQNVRVVRLDKEKNLLLVRGSIPGHNNGYVMVAKARKVAASRKKKV